MYTVTSMLGRGHLCLAMDDTVSTCIHKKRYICIILYTVYRGNVIHTLALAET